VEKVGIAASAGVGLLTLATALFYVLQWGVRIATEPLASSIAAETRARAVGDSLIGQQISTVARVIAEPDSGRRALLLERVEELRPQGK